MAIKQDSDTLAGRLKSRVRIITRQHQGIVRQVQRMQISRHNLTCNLINQDTQEDLQCLAHHLINLGILVGSLCLAPS